MTSDRSVLPSKQREVTQAPALSEAPSAPGCGVVASSGSLRHAEAAGGSRSYGQDIFRACTRSVTSADRALYSTLLAENRSQECKTNCTDRQKYSQNSFGYTVLSLIRHETSMFLFHSRPLALVADQVASVTLEKIHI